MKKLIALFLFLIAPAHAANLIYDGSVNGVKLNQTALGVNTLANVGFTANASSGILNVALTQANGSSAPGTTSSVVRAGFRNATATNGGYQIATFTGTTIISVPALASLGQTTGAAGTVYVYLLQDSSAGNDICVSSWLWDTQQAFAVSQIGSGSTVINTIYCSAAHSTGGLARLIGSVSTTWTSGSGWSAPTLLYRSDAGTVGTNQIVNGSVAQIKRSIPPNGQSASSGTVTIPGSSTWTTAMTLTITATGTRPIILFTGPDPSASTGGTYGAYIFGINRFRVYNSTRGVDLGESEGSNAGAVNTGQAFMYVDPSPAVGSNTYLFQGYSSSLTGTVSNTDLYAFEL